MGVGIQVDGYECHIHWSYSGFHDFRCTLARCIGIDLEQMKGFSKKHPKDEGYVMLGYKSWNDIRSPLKWFLNQPDDEGELSPDRCAAIYPVLRRILEDLEVIDGYDHPHVNGGNLVNAMQWAFEKKTLLRWC